MKISEVILYLEALAKGVDPRTNQELADDSVVLAPPVQASLATAASILKSHFSEAPDWDAVKSGERWSEDEDAVLRFEHEHGLTIREIAKAHRRSEGAIQSRMAKLGILVFDVAADTPNPNEPSEEP